MAAVFDPYSFGSTGVQVTLPDCAIDCIAPIRARPGDPQLDLAQSTCLAPTAPGMILAGAHRVRPELGVTHREVLELGIPHAAGRAGAARPSRRRRARRTGPGTRHRAAEAPGGEVDASHHLRVRDPGRGGRAVRTGRYRSRAMRPAAGLARPIARPACFPRDGGSVVAAVWIALIVVSTSTVGAAWLGDGGVGAADGGRLDAGRRRHGQHERDRPGLRVARSRRDRPRGSWSWSSGCRRRRPEPGGTDSVQSTSTRCGWPRPADHRVRIRQHQVRRPGRQRLGGDLRRARAERDRRRVRPVLVAAASACRSPFRTARSP